MKTLFFTALLALSFVGVKEASAQTMLSQPSGYASLLIGYAKPNGYDNRLGYGTEIGLKMTNGVNGFGYYLASTATERGAQADATHYGVGADYAFEGLAGLRAGGRLGMVNRTGLSSAFSVGPHIAWDYMIAPNLSLGVEPILLFDTGTNSGTSLYVFGTGRFWF
ncbi:MAG: hypothetical protein V4736_07650 [Bdellovibrionota bacterium]